MLIELAKAIVAKLRTHRIIKRMSAQKREEYENATKCYICRHAFEENDPKRPNVRDNDNITGFFLETVNRPCNLEHPGSFRIPVFVHNWRVYDAHLIVQEFENRPDREINGMTQHMEKYLQFEWEKNIIFHDSLQYLVASLEQLTSSFAKTSLEYFFNLHEVVLQIYFGSYIQLLDQKESSSTTTSTSLHGSINPLYLHEQLVWTSLEAWKVRTSTMPTLCTFVRIFIVKILRITCSITC